jgi:hypothetical protein
LDWLAKANQLDLAELLRQTSLRQDPPSVTLSDDDFFDLLVVSSIEAKPAGIRFAEPVSVTQNLPFEAKAREQFKYANLEVKRKLIRETAKKLGLVVTSETGGQHTPGSFHYRGLAIDVAGPPFGMERFFRTFSRHATGGGVRELFYDPLGSYDDGRRGAAIGGHHDHVHIAFDEPPHA